MVIYPLCFFIPPILYRKDEIGSLTYTYLLYSHENIFLNYLCIEEN
jgi:hypothetical protein